MKKLLSYSIVLSLLIFVNHCRAQQVGISGNGAVPDPSSILDINVTGMSPKGGLLIPRMTTTERNAISTPAEALQIFNTTTKCLEMYVNSGWYTVACPAACISPPTTANAGADQNLCNVTTATLAGNTPTVGTGVWSVISGTATVTTPSSATSGVTGLVAGVSATLGWTISNIPCTPSADYVIINVSGPPTTANAGSAINPACGVSTATLAGNTPSVGTGAWSVVSGTATITTPSSPTSGVTGLAVPGTATLRWTISNSPCTSSTSDVVITTTSCFTCGTAISDYDGNSYNTVSIGTQCWMKESLKTTHYSNGAAMVNGTGVGNIAGNYTTKYHFDPADLPANTVVYGKVYTWAAVMNGAAQSNAVPSGVQGICPTGWHVPSDAEMNIMVKYVDNTVDTTVYNGTSGVDIAIKLKETGGAHWATNNGTNSSGFTALSSGMRQSSGNYIYLGSYATQFWNTKNVTAGDAMIRSVPDTNTGSYRYLCPKDVGNSVRCIKD